MSRRPIFHVIAGPNGAGKSTLYRTAIEPRYPTAEFVNADLLAQEHYGKAATTREETETGQRLAEERRRSLMAERKDLVTESTFSHPSKLDLLRDAKQLGYDVRVYHVNLRSPDLAVKRVARRVDEGGHPVPENKTRERYERNQPIIREAVLSADRAVVFDNSTFGKPHERVLEFKQGKAVFVSTQMPAWARELYAGELLAYAPERLNRPAASYATAKKMATDALGTEARLYIANTVRGHYAGPVIAETDMHVVQKIGATAAIAHFKSSLSSVPVVGTECRVSYANGHGAVAAIERKEHEGKSYTGVIHEVTDKTVVQATGERGETVTHAKDKLYKLGGNLNALLVPGAAVVIEYGSTGMAKVRSAESQNETKRGMKR